MSDGIAKFLIGIGLVAIVVAFFALKVLLVTSLERQSETIQIMFAAAVVIGVAIMVWRLRRK